MDRRWHLRSMIAAALLSLGFVATTLAQPSPPFRLTALAVNMSNVGRAGAGAIDIAIDRWSTEQERKDLLTVFFELGPEKLLDALRETTPVGTIRAPGNLGWDLRYAHQAALPDGGTQIVILTDRPVSFWELRNRPRTLDYPFTLIDIRLKADGTGEGKASVATSITFNKNKQLVELENYASEPLRLNNVRVNR